MKVTRFFMLFFVLFFSYFSLLFAKDKMGSGWYWPTDRTEWGTALSFKSYNDDYASSGLHVAKDIMSSEGEAVYSMGGGVLIFAGNNVSYYGGAKNCVYNNAGDLISSQSIDGGVVIIRTATNNDSSIDILYGHLNVSQEIINWYNASRVNNNPVFIYSGKQIGIIRDYTFCGKTMNHLHLSIRKSQIADNVSISYGYKITAKEGYLPSSLIDFYGYMNPELYFGNNTPWNGDFDIEEAINGSLFGDLSLVENEDVSGGGQAPDVVNDSYSPDTDPNIHINSLDIRLIGGGYTKEIQKTLYWGQSFQFEGRAEFKNKI